MNPAGFIYLLLSVSCALLIAHFLKVVESRGLDTLKVLTVNYFIAVTVAILINVLSNQSFLPGFPLWIWIMAVVVGFIFIANLFVYSKSIYDNGVGVSVAAMRLSLLIPVALSIVWYSEVLTPLRIMGIILVIISLLLLVASRWNVQIRKLNSHWLLILLFLMTGIADGSKKVFEQEGLATATEAHFMGVVFLSSFIVGLAMVLYRGIDGFSYEHVKLGTAVGIPNLLTSVFLIKALQFADGTVIYSAINILIVVGGALIGKFYWQDKITRMQLIGMGLAIIAILILID